MSTTELADALCVSVRGDCTVVHLTGPVDAAARDDLTRILGGVAAGADGPIALDCTQVEFADSTLVDLVVELRRSPRAPAVSVEQLDVRTQRVFSICQVPTA